MLSGPIVIQYFSSDEVVQRSLGLCGMDFFTAHDLQCERGEKNGKRKIMINDLIAQIWKKSGAAWWQFYCIGDSSMCSKQNSTL